MTATAIQLAPKPLTAAEATLLEMVLREDFTKGDLGIARLAVLRERIPGDVAAAISEAVNEHSRALTPKIALDARMKCIEEAGRHPLGRVLLRELDAAYAADKARR